jgi:FkbM family methyltransferase
LLFTGSQEVYNPVTKCKLLVSFSIIGRITPHGIHLMRGLLDFVFKKKLPPGFGSSKIFVSPRADVRVLKWGWDSCAFDLKLVVETNIKPGMLIWDIGANLGIFSFLSAYKAGKKGQVFALEADTKYADIIHRSSLLLSDEYAPVSVLCAAIFDKRGITSLGISKKGHARNRLVENGQEVYLYESVKQCISVRGDDLLKYWGKPDFIKIDVEGAESAVLKGCRQTLLEAKPNIYIEVSPNNKEIVSLQLSELGYETFHLNGDGSETPQELCSFYTMARPRLH